MACPLSKDAYISDSLNQAHTQFVQIFEAMSDLYYSYRSGSDRSWLPVCGEERNDTIWKKWWSWIQHILHERLQFSNPMLFISPDLHLSLLYLSSLIPFSSYPTFHIHFLPISCVLLLPPGQAFLIVTFLLQRSWDTLRQHWERLSVEFNLDLCFTPRQRNSSLL